MAESTLSINYADIVREVARKVSAGKIYNTGLITAAGTTVTLASGTVPSWVGTTAAGTAGLNSGGTIYSVVSRTNGTTFVLDRSLTTTSTAYVLLQSQETNPDEVFIDIDAIIRDGYKQALFVTGHDPHHEWSFLRKSTTIALTSSDTEVDLADDFGQHLIKVTSIAGESKRNLQIVSPADIDAMRAMENAAASHPRYCSWRPKTWDPTVGQRFELMVYPKEDDSGTVNLNVEYRMLPDKLDPTNLYPIGGGVFDQVVMASCLALAEQRYHKAAGVETGRFEQRLQAAIESDLAGKRARSA